jgi:hypothetical protein
MNRVPHQELLFRLRAELQHFEESPDFGDADSVAVIRQHLLLRIREVEGSLQYRTGIRSDTGMQSKPAIRSEAA